jgi:hypothetical protein
VPPQKRIREILGKLHKQLERLQSGTPHKKQQAYARCLPLLKELEGLNGPPLPVRELKALIHEAGWHLRSLAGLVTASKLETEEQHATWAHGSLCQIARCVGLS